MTDPETIVSLKNKIEKQAGQIARLKKRLLTKIKHEKGYLQATSATPQLVYDIELKDRAVLEE